MKKKAELFNTFFGNHYTLLNNSSVLSSNLAKLTNEPLYTVNFSTDNISKIRNNLETHKARAHHMLSIRMVKLCGNSICKLLSIIFKSYLKEGKFPSDWSKAHVVPVRKRGDKHCLKSYRPVFLFPICSKTFERLIYNELFTFFIDNNLVSSNQSGFRPADSCLNQLIAITHEIYKSFDDGHEVRGVYLDISNAFDKVWHGGLLLKL